MEHWEDILRKEHRAYIQQLIDSDNAAPTLAYIADVLITDSFNHFNQEMSADLNNATFTRSA